MKNLLFVCAFVLVGAVLSPSIMLAGDPTTSIFIVRTGQQITSPRLVTYHLAEFFQLRGMWIVPDGGVIDFGTADYRELFAGGGRTLYFSKKLMIAEEIYFTQSIGPGSGSARYVYPWSIVHIHFTPGFMGEVVYFPYIPLDSHGQVQHVLEHCTLQRDLTKSVKVGAGYAGYKFGSNAWQNKPFVTATFVTGAGSFEFWLQKMPGGAQVQLRCTLAYTQK